MPIIILKSGVEGVAEGTSPETLGGLHAAWRKDIEAFGPFAEPDGGSKFFSDSPVWLSRKPGVDLDIFVCGPCSSTMDAAWALVEQGIAGDWAAVVAPTQSSGRGQLRREWVSPPGNMHLSIVLPSPSGAPGGDLGTLLPLAVGAMLASYLEGKGLNPRMKWPNDVLLEGGKIGGILVEDRGGRTVAGIGMNLAYAPPDSRMRAEHSNPAASLDNFGVRLGPLEAASELVNHGRNWYGNFLDVASSRDRILKIEKRLAFLGVEVAVEGTAEPFQGRTIGLNHDGGLIIERNGQDEVLYSGSIRPVALDDWRS